MLGVHNVPLQAAEELHVQEEEEHCQKMCMLSLC